MKIALTLFVLATVVACAHQDSPEDDHGGAAVVCLKVDGFMKVSGIT